jgi:hypothetical protein
MRETVTNCKCSVLCRLLVLSLYCVPFNLLKPTAYGMHQQVKYFNNCTFCPYCIYVFCICLRTNSDLCHLQHELIGFYNQDESVYSSVRTGCVIKEVCAPSFKG